MFSAVKRARKAVARARACKAVSTALVVSLSAVKRYIAAENEVLAFVEFSAFSVRYLNEFYKAVKGRDAFGYDRCGHGNFVITFAVVCFDYKGLNARFNAFQHVVNDNFTVFDRKLSAAYDCGGYGVTRISFAKVNGYFGVIDSVCR